MANKCEILLHADVINKLKTLSKEELIDFIGAIKYGYKKSEFNNYIAIVEQKCKQRLNDQLYSKVKAADAIRFKAMDEYTNYMTELQNEYGNNGVLYFKDVPDAKLIKLVDLKKAMDQAIADAQAAYENWKQKIKL